VDVDGRCRELDALISAWFIAGTELDHEREKWGFVDNGGEMPCVVSSHTFSHNDWLAMARISEALRITEGQHPKDISELLVLAAELEPEMARWSP